MEAFESLMEELPERFQEFSKMSVGHDEKIILVPEHPRTDNSGTVTRRIMNQRIYRVVEEHGFVQYMTNRSKNGVGIDFWYKYDPA